MGADTQERCGVLWDDYQEAIAECSDMDTDKEAGVVVYLSSGDVHVCQGAACPHAVQNDQHMLVCEMSGMVVGTVHIREDLSTGRMDGNANPDEICGTLIGSGVFKKDIAMLNEQVQYIANTSEARDEEICALQPLAKKKRTGQVKRGARCVDEPVNKTEERIVRRRLCAPKLNVACNHDSPCTSATASVCDDSEITQRDERQSPASTKDASLPNSDAAAPRSRGARHAVKVEPSDKSAQTPALEPCLKPSSSAASVAANAAPAQKPKPKTKAKAGTASGDPAAPKPRRGRPPKKHVLATQLANANPGAKNSGPTASATHDGLDNGNSLGQDEADARLAANARTVFAALILETHNIISKLVIYERKNDGANVHAPAPKAEAPRVDPRAMDAGFLFNAALSRYGKACAGTHTAPQLDIVHNLHIMSLNAAAEAKRRATKTTASPKLVEKHRGDRAILLRVRVRELVANLCAKLWQSSLSTPYMESNRRSSDSFKPFVAGVLYALKRGVQLTNGTFVVPEAPELAASLPALRATAHRSAAKALHASSHRGLCTLHRSIASLDAERQRLVFAEAAEICSQLVRVLADRSYDFS